MKSGSRRLAFLLIRYALCLPGVVALGVGMVRTAPRLAEMLGTSPPDTAFERSWWMAVVVTGGACLVAGTLVLRFEDSFLVRLSGVYLFGFAAALSVAVVVGADIELWYPWILGTSFVMAVLESGALKAVRCRDTGKRAMPWQMAHCHGPFEHCSERLVHRASLAGGACAFCQEEIGVQEKMAQPRELAADKRCEIRYEKGSTFDPVEYCYCQEKRTFCRSLYLQGFCPLPNCRFGQKRFEERRRVREGSA